MFSGIKDYKNWLMVGMEHCEAVKFYDSCSFWVVGLSLNCDANFEENKNSSRFSNFSGKRKFWGG
jgi:hypothetical protein